MPVHYASAIPNIIPPAYPAGAATGAGDGGALPVLRVAEAEPPSPPFSDAPRDLDAQGGNGPGHGHGPVTAVRDADASHALAVAGYAVFGFLFLAAVALVWYFRCSYKRRKKQVGQGTAGLWILHRALVVLQRKH